MKFAFEVPKKFFQGRTATHLVTTERYNRSGAATLASRNLKALISNKSTLSRYDLSDAKGDFMQTYSIFGS
ncbi:MAG: hypothetical protein ACJATK_002781 [Paracoccaceae bacterium]|jgi:hypothetical protein